MRDPKSFLLMLGALAAFSLVAAAPARATAEPTGCCCMVTAKKVDCSPMSEKDCVAKQQAVPKYDDKTKYDAAVKKSELEEGEKMESGWRAGACPAK
jgi:hypothetical protein